METRWTFEDDRALRELYTTTPNSRLVQILGRTNKAIRNRASTLGLYKNYISPKKCWTKAEEKELISIYSFASHEKLTQVFQCDISVIYQKAGSLGLSRNAEVKNTLISKSSTRRHINHTYFRDIDTEGKAYFLGLLWADGSVNKKTSRVTLKLGEADRHIVDSLQKELDTDYSIYCVKSDQARHQDNYGISIKSRPIVEDLIRYNIIPNKTYINCELPELKLRLIHHFFRGIFDGDGSITGQNNNIHVSITGSRATSSWALETTRHLLGIGGGIHQRTCMTYTWQIGGALQLSKFAVWLYGDATFYLTRKYNKFIEMGLL